VEKPEEMRSLGRQRRRWEDNIKMDIGDCVLLPEMLGIAFLQTFTALFLTPQCLIKIKVKLSLHTLGQALKAPGS
jgi:hypothetical protein